MTTATLNYSTRIRDKLPQHLDKVDKKAKRTDKSLKKVSKTTETIGKTSRTKIITKDIKSMGQAAERTKPLIKGTTLALVGLFGAALAFLHLIRRGDAWTNMSNKLRLITKDTTDLIETQHRLVAVAVETRSDIDALVTTYQRVDKALVRMGASSEDTHGVVKALALGIKTTGIAADEATNALRQITQAFNKGKLDGDEFRSVGENMPVVLDAIAKEAGISRGELMKWARQGKITADLMQRGLLKALPQLEEDFKKIKPTVGDSIVALSSAWTAFTGELTAAGGLLQPLIDLFKSLADETLRWATALKESRLGGISAREAKQLIAWKDTVTQYRQLAKEKPQHAAFYNRIADEAQAKVDTTETRRDRIRKEMGIDVTDTGRSGKDVYQISKGEAELGQLEQRWNFLKQQRASQAITEEQFQTEGRALQKRAQGLPLSETFAEAYTVSQTKVPEGATDKQRQAIIKANKEDVDVAKRVQSGFAGLTGELKKMIVPLDETKKNSKEAAKELTEREKFENKTLDAMADVNKEMVVINTQRKLGLIDDQQAAQALVALGQRKKEIKAEYLAEIATNDKLKPSLGKLNEEFDKMGKKVDPAIEGARETVARQTVVDMYVKQLEQQREDDRKKAESLSAARKSAAIGLGQQAATGIISEVGAGFMGESLGIDPATGKPREAQAGGGTAVDSLNAGITKFIESGDPLQALFAALAPIIRDVMKALSGLIPLFSAGLGKVFKALNKLIPILANALAPILEGISPLLDVVATIFDAVGNILKQTLVPSMKILGPILKAVSIVLRAVMDLLVKYWNFWIDVISSITGGLVKFDKFKTSDQLASADRVVPGEGEASGDDKTDDLLQQQLEEQKKQREIAERQLRAQLEAERRNSELFRIAAQEAFTISAAGVTDARERAQDQIVIINSIDPTDIDRRIAGEAGQRAVLNTIRLNEEDISEVVGQ